MIQLFFLSCLSAAFAASNSLHTLHRHGRSNDQCNNFVKGTFGLCSAAGYNDTFEFPKDLTGPKLRIAGFGFKRLFQRMKSCSQVDSVVLSILCSYMVPQCSKGERVYPCKRVCNEFLKQCEKAIPEAFLDYVIAACHVLPTKKANSGKCHEPPNFITNESIPGPLDRNCSPLIIPVCKNLGVSNYTLVSLKQQKRLYQFYYRKEYNEGNVETNDPPDLVTLSKKYPRCKNNIKKLYCGEYLPPCFPDEPSAEGPGFYTICQSVCDEIIRDCPDFFRNDFPQAEYCSFAGKENTSHGYCRRKEWPRPFHWTRYIQVPTKTPLTQAPQETTGPKSAKTAVIIAVAVAVTITIVAVVLGGALWWKWRRIPSRSGYKKQEEDRAPLEGAMEL